MANYSRTLSQSNNNAAGLPKVTFTAESRRLFVHGWREWPGWLKDRRRWEGRLVTKRQDFSRILEVLARQNAEEDGEALQPSAIKAA